jgi:hypothetical protein
VAADHHVDARDLGDGRQIARIADMRQRDDLADTLAGQRLDGGLDRRHVLGDQHVFAGAGKFARVVRDRADETDLLAAAFEHHIGFDTVAERGFVAGEDVGRQDREFGDVEERGEARFAIIEFVVAHRHRVGTDLVEDSGFDGSLVGRIEQRTLEVVAGIEHQHVVGAETLARLVDSGHETRRAAEAIAFGLVFGRARRIVLVDRLDAAVPVVHVNDIDREVRGRPGCADGQRGHGHHCQSGKSSHLFLPPRSGNRRTASQNGQPARAAMTAIISMFPPCAVIGKRQSPPNRTDMNICR